MLHYYPRHVSSINMPIFRRTNCIHTASGIVTLCKRLYSTPVESGLQSSPISTAAQTVFHRKVVSLVLWFPTPCIYAFILLYKSAYHDGSLSQITMFQITAPYNITRLFHAPSETPKQTYRTA